MEKTIKSLIEKKCRWSAADREALRPYLVRYGIEEPAKAACASCWRDAAIMCAKAMRDEAAKAGAVNAEGFRLIKGDSGENGCVFKGRFLSNATMDKTTYEWAVKNGFPARLWL